MVNGHESPYYPYVRIIARELPLILSCEPLMFERFTNPLGNREATSLLHEEVDTFSLNGSQLYVGSLRGPDGSSTKAISLLTNVFNPEGGMGGIALYTFSKSDAKRLLGFLQSVLGQKLPATFSFPPSVSPFLEEDGQIEWTVTKVVDEWHGGGGLKGKLGGCGGHIISISSAKRLAECVQDFFDIEP